MSVLKQCAEVQSGVIYREQFEDWLSNITEQLEEKQNEVGCDVSLHEYYTDGYYDGIEQSIGIINR